MKYFHLKFLKLSEIIFLVLPLVLFTINCSSFSVFVSAQSDTERKVKETKFNFILNEKQRNTNSGKFYIESLKKKFVDKGFIYDPAAITESLQCVFDYGIARSTVNHAGGYLRNLEIRCDYISKNDRNPIFVITASSNGHSGDFDFIFPYLLKGIFADFPHKNNYRSQFIFEDD